jgi:hypothetical protein
MTPEQKAAIGVGAAAALTFGIRGLRSRSGPRGTIRLLGDSYAAGLGAAIATPPALSTGPELDFAADAIVGSTTATWAEFFEASTGTHPCRWLVLSLGTNDAGSIERLRQDIGRIQKVAKRKASGIAWILPPRAVTSKVATASKAWGAWRAAIGEGRTFDTDAHVKVSLSPDGIHPIDYRPWAEALWGWLALLSA